jgi:hypothetical protein
MAFRIEKAAVRGELSNEERGVVTGRIWLAGRKEPLLLSLRGDCLRDLAGCTVRFTNPRPEPDATLAVLAPEQNGVTGELTASRKIRQPAVSDQEMLELLEKGQPIPCRIANCLYLEWYSEENGRVVLETTDYAVAVGMPAWSMSAEENADQLAASQLHFQRFLHAITGDDPEADDENENDEPDDDRDEAGLAAELRESALASLDPEDQAAGPAPEVDEDGFELVDGEPLNEFEWEQELRDADRRAEAYQEALEKYRDHPEREKMIAAALGWDDEPDDDEDAEADASLREALMDDSLEVFDGTGPTPAWAEGAGEGGEPGDEDPFGSHHPLSQRAMDFALALQREAEERGLMGDTPDARDHSPVLSLIMHIITLGGKLAGALDGWAQGHDPDPGFIIAMLKRAQVPLNEALHAFDCIDAASLNAETRQWLQSRKRDLFDLRRDIIDLMHQLRTS